MRSQSKGRERVSQIDGQTDCKDDRVHVKERGVGALQRLTYKGSDSGITFRSA